jgi:hypothetical protein
MRFPMTIAKMAIRSARMAGLRDDAGIVATAGQHEIHVGIEEMDELEV